MDFKDFAESIIGFNPYEYQAAVAEKLLSGKNVILSVPTGAGKTWASVLPFLYAQENNLNFPKKMIYSLPLRTLANSIYEDVVDVLRKKGFSEKEITRQTGEYSDDKYFQKDIIFSTIDQTLSNFLCFPLPLSHGQANINAGALIGSYLVFDEFHLLDSKLSMATTLGMLKMLGNLCRCCIMTATLSDDFMDLLEKSLPNYEVIKFDSFENDRDKIGSLLPKQDKKTIKVIKGVISAPKIIAKHDSKSIVICNRVETAQKIYNDLILEQKTTENQIFKNAEIICLHSRFFDKDRKEKEKKLKKLFGKKTPNTNAILIATQVIEAGMDISCNVMHTEISPISSFLQRVGRCARFENEQGEIFIYQLHNEEEKELMALIDDVTEIEDKKEIIKLKSKYLPYQEKDCEATFLELEKYQTLDGDIPKKLIESILGKDEKEIINAMASGQGGGFNQDKIRESWNACQKNRYRSTIRDIQSVEITLITEGEVNEIIRNPYIYQSVGMYKWSLVGWLNKIIKDEGPIPFDTDDWLVKELKDADDIFLENDEDVKFDLKDIKPNEFKNIPTQVYVNAKYFGYECEFGFNWQYDDTFNKISPKKEEKEKDDPIKPLEKDTFYQHNMGLIGAFEEDFLGKKDNRDDKLDFVFAQLAEYIEASDLQKVDFIKLIQLMIVLHDYGKLNIAWQEPMQKYQALKEGIDFENFKEILGHTEYDSKKPIDVAYARKARIFSRPTHAGVGAYAAQEILPELYDNSFLKSAISMAIAKHHSPDILSKGYPVFNISVANYKAIQRLFDEFDFDIELGTKNKYKGNLDGFECKSDEEYLTYLFFVRILRLCDQKATENLKHYFKGN